jgi:hypothetical protein
MNRSRLSLALFLQLATVFCAFPFSVSRADWGPGGCGPVGPNQAVAANYVWVPYNGCQYLYCNGIQIGGYEPASGIYRPYDASTNTWGPVPALTVRGQQPCQCCKDCKCDPCNCKDKPGPCCEGCNCAPSSGKTVERGQHGQLIQNFGLVRDKLSKGAEPKYYIGGKKVAKHEFDAYAASVDDDSMAARITVIGPKDLRIPVLALVAQTPEAAGALVKAYDPINWAVARAGFKTDGKPTTYVQRADGGVVARFDVPPTQIALATAVVKAKRVPDPNYDPKKDPNGAAAAPFSFDLSSLQPYWPLILVGGIGLLFLFRRG